MALHQVKIYRKGKLAKIIPPEKLFIQGDNQAPGDKPKPPKKKGWIISCEFCKRKAKIFQASRTTCKRSVCEKEARDRKKENKLKMKGGSRVVSKS
jgi:hypothetical protein